MGFKFASDGGAGVGAGLRLALLGIHEREATFAARGFARGSEAEARLGSVGKTFIAGYRTALRCLDPERCAAELNASVEHTDVGFAFEGAGMAFALCDAMSPWKGTRLQRFSSGAGAPHVYMIHVGAGWALARVGPGRWKRWRRMDPLLRWLALDGFGFHDAYFHPGRCLDAAVRRKLVGRARRVFDQGVGRALWFVCGADAERIAERIESVEVSHREDLWSGVGLASSYAGGVSRESLGRLCQASMLYRPALAQGACFGAEARSRAGNEAEHTDTACRTFANMSAAEAAECARAERAALSDAAGEDAYERWRAGIRARVARRLHQAAARESA